MQRKRHVNQKTLCEYWSQRKFFGWVEIRSTSNRSRSLNARKENKAVSQKGRGEKFAP